MSFFSQRKVADKKQKLAAISSRIVGTGSSTITQTSASSGGGGSATVTQRSARPPIKVSTVTRTIQVIKRVVPLPTSTPFSPSSSSTSGRQTSSVTKRKADHQSHPTGSAKSRKTVQSDTVPKKKAVVKVNRQRKQQEEEEFLSGSEEETDSSEDDLSRPLTVGGRKRQATPIVERDVSASLDGDVDCISGELLVKWNRSAYIQYFVDPSDPLRPTKEWAGEDVPTVVLEYPGIKASERLLLLTPMKGGEEYDPIEDVMTTIRLTLDNFLTPTQASTLFSHTPASASSFSAFLSAPQSRSSTPVDTVASVPLIRALEKAKAKRDGPGFLAAVERFNVGIRGLKAEGKITENIAEMKGVNDKVWTKITGQVYERAVGPEIEKLKNYPAFSDNVYGELLPRFMSEICQQTNLGPNSVFVDLGSGVGNCVLQVALATGCEAWGFENMEHASALARSQVEEAKKRFRMWGLKGGFMKAVEADFCACDDVGKVIRRADVVLVNNEVFSSALNERLSLLFLDLPSNAQIVSLKAFASSFTLSAHNQDSPLAILDQGTERRYGRKSVSWKDEGGTFFIAKVDRSKLEKFARDEERRRKLEV